MLTPIFSKSSLVISTITLNDTFKKFQIIEPILLESLYILIEVQFNQELINRLLLEIRNGDLYLGLPEFVAYDIGGFRFGLLFGGGEIFDGLGWLNHVD